MSRVGIGRRVAVLAVALLPHTVIAEINFSKTDSQLAIAVDGKPFATYVWNNSTILRPFFANVYAPNGTRVTRPHPPDPVVNKGNDDHETMHPGLWLAFGDISGMDVWRNKARVRHVRFVEGPSVDGDHGTFAVENAYEPLEGGAGAIVERCRYDVFALDMGWFLIARSTFTSASEIRFGDQEEMGFGMRVNTPLTVKLGNGALVNSEGGRNEYGTWGQRAKWCSAFGTADGAVVGATLMPGPDNFRPSWFHSRDYGLVVANPFGKKSMTAPDDASVPPDSTVAPPGAEFQFAFGVYVFAGKGAPDNASAYEWFQELLGQTKSSASTE